MWEIIPECEKNGVRSRTEEKVEVEMQCFQVSGSVPEDFLKEAGQSVSPQPMAVFIQQLPHFIFHVLGQRGRGCCRRGGQGAGQGLGGERPHGVLQSRRSWGLWDGAGDLERFLWGR